MRMGDMAGSLSRIGFQRIHEVNPSLVHVSQPSHFKPDGKRSQFDLLQGDGLGGHAQGASLAVELPASEFIFELLEVLQQVRHGGHHEIITDIHRPSGSVEIELNISENKLQLSGERVQSSMPFTPAGMIHLASDLLPACHQTGHGVMVDVTLVLAFLLCNLQSIKNSLGHTPCELG